MEDARTRRSALLLGATAFATLAHFSMREKSPTFDEVAHLPAGYTHLTLRDYRLVPEQPPLVKAMAALPLLAMDVRVPDHDAAWARRRPYEFGRRFLFEWNDARRLVSAGRHVMPAVAALLLAVVASWAWSRWGAAVGALTLSLGALNPDLLAHGQLVTTDVPVTLAMFASLIHFERLIARPSARGALLGGLLLGCALATKFSSLMLVPLLAALGTLSVLGSPLAVGEAGGGRGRRLLRLAVLLVAVCLSSLVVIWAAYGFRAHVTSDPAVNQAFTLEHERPANELLWRAALAAQRFRLLPDAYLFGLLRFARHAERRQAFLLGEISEDGWWYYFPVTLALKTPIPLLMLLGIALALALRDWRRHVKEPVLWLLPAAYLAIAMSRDLNIGHRHLLPLLPFLLVAAARAAVTLWRRGGKAGRGLMVVLLTWYAAGAVRIHPHYLAYFNELVGPESGHRYLVDSNLDWGQDLPGLKAYLDRSGIERIKLSYFGTAEPAYYGIRCDRLPGYPAPDALATAVDPGDLVAVSATNLEGVYLENDPDAMRLMRRLRRQQPIASIGYSILIYRADFEWRHP